MRRKAWIAIAVFTVAACAIVAFGLMRRERPEAAPSITLADGSLISVAGISFGTNHMVGSSLARTVAKLPGPIRSVVQRFAGAQVALRFQQTTLEPVLMVWLLYTNKPPPGTFSSGYYDVLVADDSGFISGSVESLSTFAAVPHLQFKVLPRRSRNLTLTFFHHDTNAQVRIAGKLPVKNPIYGNYPQWTPEPAPITKRAGDLEVTLDQLVTGHNNSTRHSAQKGGGTKVTYGTDRKDGRNYTACHLHLRSLGDTNQVWKVASEEISDATGNRSKNNSMSWGGEGHGFSFMPSLWPSENAWRIKLDLEREKGFAPGEQFTFRNVPLGNINTTNIVGWMSNYAGLKLTLSRVIRRPPNTNDSWSSTTISNVEFTHSDLPPGMHLDLVAARSDSGQALTPGSWSSGNRERSYSFHVIPVEAKTADFTFVLQTGRTVEFTVKPELAVPEKESSNQ